MQKSLVDIVLEKSKKAMNRPNWDNMWDETARYVIPRKENKYGNVSGEQKTRHLYDSTAPRANSRLASGLHSLLTNPSVEWFGLTTGDETLDKVDSVYRWLQTSTNKLHLILNSSNFQTAIHEVYLDLPSFGTGVLRIEEDVKDIVRFYSSPIYDIYISENNKKRVDTVYRELELSLFEIKLEFGEDKLSDSLKRVMGKGSCEKYKILHAVLPMNTIENHTENLVMDSGNPDMEFASIYILEKEKLLLKFSGFEEFPYAVPRFFKLSGEVYGRSPGMETLADARTLNAWKKVVLQGGQLATLPPLQTTDQGISRPIKFKPLGMNYRRPGQDEIKPINLGARPDIGLGLIERIQEDIEDGFFKNELRIVENNRMTATEVMQRRDEQFRTFSALLGRLHDELLKPTVDRVFSIALRNNVFGEIPQEILDAGIEVLSIKYKSLIAKAQQSADAEGFQRAIASIASIVEFHPEVMDNIDADGVLRHNFKLYDVHPDLIRDSKEVQKIREDRQKQMEEQRRQEAEAAKADVVNKVAPAMQR